MAFQQQRQAGSGQHVQVGRDVSGGSVVNAGNGVTIIINNGAQFAPNPEQPPNLTDLWLLLSGLTAQEQKSFGRFVDDQLGEMLLTDIDGKTMKRIYAYAKGIVGKRK